VGFFGWDFDCQPWPKAHPAGAPPTEEDAPMVAATNRAHLSPVKAVPSAVQVSRVPYSCSFDLLKLFTGYLYRGFTFSRK
jgi:hypothetical protein